MKEIPLTQGKVTIVDEENFEKLSKYKWCALKKGANGKYGHTAVRNVLNKHTRKSDMILMHRLILNCPIGKQVDHINGDQLDNRKQNLRICTPSQNQHNKPKNRNNTSGFKGVTWSKSCNKWQSAICVNGKMIFLGVFSEKIDAYYAYCEASKKYHGDFSNVN